MRLLMLSCLFICTVITARSQVTIEQNRYVPMSFMAVNIFDVDIVNPGMSSFNGYLKGRITQAGTGKVIAEASTGLITINAGRNNFSSFALQPVFSYSDTYTESTGKLSFGNYEICVSLLGSNNEPLTMQCAGLAVTTISPPYLLSPPDRASLNYKYPFLVWTLPGASAATGVKYRLVLSEIFPNQTAYDALANNFRILDADGLISNTLPYPSTALPLEKK